MPAIPVMIVRFVDESQPGFVECVFEDAQGRNHTIVDKIPCFTEAELWVDSAYPQAGVVGCQVLARFVSADGKRLARITLEQPDHVESTTGLSEFVVLESEIQNEAR